MKRFWQRLPLQLKIFSSFGLLLVCSMVAVSLYASFIVTRELDQQTTASIQRIIDSSGQRVAAELSLLSQQIRLLSNNHSLQSALKDYDEQTELEKWERWSRIYSIGETWIQSRRPIDLRFHLPGSMLFLRDEIAFIPNEDLPNALIERQGNRTPLWHVSEDGATLSCLTPIRSGWEHLGYVELMIQSSQLSSAMDPLSSTGVSLYLLFADGQIMAGNTGAAAPENLSLPETLPTESTEPILTRFQRDGDALLRAIIPLPNMPLFYLVGEVPIALISESGSVMLQSILLGGLAVLALAFLFAFLISQSVTRRLRTLSLAMARLESGDLDVQIDQAGADELGRMLVRFDHMAGALKTSHEENEHMQRLKRESELRLLQAQINPHFIHNTLESISWAAKRGDAAQVDFLVQNLSGFLRLSLSKTEQLSTLSRELALVQFYFNVQAYRFQGKVSLDVDIPPEAKEALLPPLLIQPLVENALLHGLLKGGQRCGTVLVRVQAMEDLLIIEVRDDGAGMDAAALAALRSQLENPRAGSYGLWNVHQRVRGYAGNDYGLCVESAPGEGTLCLLTLPFCTQEPLT